MRQRHTTSAATEPEVEAQTRQRLLSLRSEFGDHLSVLAEFWRTRAVDLRHGGYRTSFDAQGQPVDEQEKYLLAQTRLLWTFSQLAAATGDQSLLDLATYGYDYLTTHFHDATHGGWYWKTHLDGRVKDPAKLAYGQSFAIYALAAYGRIAKSQEAVDAARSTFDALHVHSADVLRGGYYENLNRDWSPAQGQWSGSDRKSLDIHMHLLECYTELTKATESDVHRRRLAEVRELLLDRMIDPATGAGGNQYDLAWNPVEPIVIDRTWIAERGVLDDDRTVATTTSYGHNLELGWLLVRADQVLGLPLRTDAAVVQRLADHALEFGYDSAHGGVFREGPPAGPASDRDKEFWQNSEALVGFLEGYRLVGDPRYLDAFEGTWRFVSRHMIDPAGEWRIRTTEDGAVLDGALGNQWTGGYHTCRAAIESLALLDCLLDGSDEQ